MDPQAHSRLDRGVSGDVRAAPSERQGHRLRPRADLDVRGHHLLGGGHVRSLRFPKQEQEVGERLRRWVARQSAVGFNNVVAVVVGSWTPAKFMAAGQSPCDWTPILTRRQSDHDCV